jgi:hypothetical protein
VAFPLLKRAFAKPTTLRHLRETLGLSGETHFTEALQDLLALNLLGRRGGDPDQLRKEWQGLEKVSDDIIKAAFRPLAEAASSVSTTEVAAATPSHRPFESTHTGWGTISSQDCQ